MATALAGYSAFAKRYPYLQFYTTINEIFIAAMFSGQYGWWNECKSDFRSPHVNASNY